MFMKDFVAPMARAALATTSFTFAFTFALVGCSSAPAEEGQASTEEGLSTTTCGGLYGEYGTCAPGLKCMGAHVSPDALVPPAYPPGQCVTPPARKVAGDLCHGAYGGCGKTASLFTSLSCDVGAGQLVGICRAPGTHGGVCINGTTCNSGLSCFRYIVDPAATEWLSQCL